MAGPANHRKSGTAPQDRRHGPFRPLPHTPKHGPVNGDFPEIGHMADILGSGNPAAQRFERSAWTSLSRGLALDADGRRPDQTPAPASPGFMASIFVTSGLPSTIGASSAILAVWAASSSRGFSFCHSRDRRGR